MVNDKKWGIINGATGGIGAEVALKLIGEGYSLVLLGRSKTKLNQQLKQLKKHRVSNQQIIKTHALDLTQNKEIDQFIASLKTNRIKPNIFINAAGIVKRGNLHNTRYDDLSLVLDCCVLGVIRLTSAITILMKIKKVPGTVVLVNGILSKRPDPNLMANSTSTAAIAGFVKSAAKFLGRYGIRINTVNPGPTDTPLLQQARKLAAKKAKVSEEKINELMANKTALGKIASSAEIADAIYFLCSDQSNHITGSSIDIDGCLL
ncbi:MAG: hypothetical protein COV52_05135 [Gammaproteobacteria bacterium CG11_big_fil_rev_8_21_14_0_20_46_22]|nr:MAG: hypothetical protein COW05_10120 [Gammaproteobacteria bacterium CG12_big_fil_rev_8_21_14_0_65_46_12]PIR11180.1 MAG: hypothetical protein COV52_05135 [Gammaproteobacteria bacterium CG11_big_fil_rev_8_21_14_0_20_46_22]